MVNIEEKILLAEKYFKDGYNCTQAIVLAYSDIIGIDKVSLATISAPFGAGMGRLREVCGAVSGMIMVSGYVFKANNPNDSESLKRSYNGVQVLAKEFTDKNGSIVCRELLGLNSKNDNTTVDNTKKHYTKRPCSEYVCDCARIIGEVINNNQTI